MTEQKQIYKCNIRENIVEILYAVKDKNVIGLTFHPELTNDTKIYKYFLNLI